MYGSETWSLTVTLKKKVEWFKLKVLRVIVGQKWDSEKGKKNYQRNNDWNAAIDSAWYESKEVAMGGAPSKEHGCCDRRGYPRER